MASVALATIVFLGCDSSTATVSGNVTLDGQPVKSGVISFVATEGTAAPVTANIVDGAYSVVVGQGKKLVQISAPVVVGQRKENPGPNAPLIDITQESVPPRYNSQSELSLDVTGSLEKDFDLQSAGK